MNLKTRIIVIISVLLLSVSILSSIYNYKVNLEATQKQLKTISLPLSLDNIYTEIQQRMIEPLIVSSLMANDTFLKDWLGGNEKDISQVQRYLKEIQDKYNVFTTFVVSDKTHNYYHSKGLIDKINKKNDVDDWFFDFKKSKNLYEVNLDIDTHFSDSLIMFINYKVKDYANKFIAVTGVGVKLYDIEDMLYSFKHKYGYDVYFVDESGEIILYTKELNKRGNLDYINGLKKIKSEIFKNKKHQFEYYYDNEEYLLSTKYIDQLKLYLFVEINKKSYIDDLRNNFYVNMLISLLVTLFVASIIIYIINIYQKQLEILANSDALTKLSNRRSFNNEIKKIFNLYYRQNIKNVHLALIDIDDFKEVNDILGHLVGDKVLVRLAEILKQQFRKTDLVVRWGGEEFAVVLIDTTKEKSIELIDNLQESIRNDKELAYIIDGKLNISVGLAELESKDSLDGLILKADEALYEAKDLGKDQLVVAK